MPDAKRRRVLAGLAGLIAAGLGAGAMVASGGIDSGPALNGCATETNGFLRLVASGAECGPGETAVSWNMQGPPGPAGSTGPAGPPGPAGPAATAFNVTLSGFSARQTLATVGTVAVEGTCDLRGAAIGVRPRVPTRVTAQTTLSVERDDPARPDGGESIQGITDTAAADAFHQVAKSSQGIGWTGQVIAANAEEVVTVAYVVYGSGGSCRFAGTAIGASL